MPRYLKTNGKKVPNIKIVKAWIEIPVKCSSTSLKNTEIYLVSTRVADYIEKLEKKINGELPKLPMKKQ
jgi:hypothetical protein